MTRSRSATRRKKYLTEQPDLVHPCAVKTGVPGASPFIVTDECASTSGNAGLDLRLGRRPLDQAEVRYRRSMIEPRTGGKCRYCGHSVDRRHVGTWCGDCHQTGTTCGSKDLLDQRARERDSARVTR